MNALVATSIGGAKLPQTYEAAKAALAECNAVDECKEWRDKAAALASYAKQAEDDELQKTAMRIKGRAVRRYGELLAEIEPARGGDRGNQYRQMDGGDPLPSRKQAASDAGLSERQMKDGLRVASIPEQKFESMIEREDPPTVTELAKVGTQPRKQPAPEPVVDLGGRSPEQFNAAMRFTGLVERFSAELAAFESDKARIIDVVAWLDADEAAKVSASAPQIRALLAAIEGTIR